MRVINVHGPDDVRVDDAPAPMCGPWDVIVAIKACGVCGSDVLYVHLGGPPLGGRCPMPLGHEPAGEVIEVGDDVRGIPVGMRVTFNPVFDETDLIGNGGTQGALSEHVAVRDAGLGRNVFRIPDDVPFEVAALTEPLSVAMHAVNRAEAGPGHTAVVFGAGPVGVGIVAWLKLRGVRHVVAVDLSAERLLLAASLGADTTVLAADDVVTRLRALHGTEHVQGAPVAGTDIWIDAAGAPQVFETIMRGAKWHATVVVVGVHKQPVQLDLVNFLTKELRFTSSIAYPTEFGDVASALAVHWRGFVPMITDRVPVEHAAEAIALAGSGDIRGKVMVTF